MVESVLNITLHALAHPTRRSLIAHLFDGEAKVTELARPFNMSLNTVSKHIQVLEQAGLVTRRKVGRDHFLKFDAKPLDEATAWMQAQQKQWTDRLDRLDSALAEVDARKD